MPDRHAGKRAVLRRTSTTTPSGHLHHRLAGRFLKKAPFCLFMVTHDRYFLDRVCARIIEISAGTTQSFSGGYSSYLEQKAQRESRRFRQQERFDNILRQEQAWLRQGPKAVRQTGAAATSPGDARERKRSGRSGGADQGMLGTWVPAVWAARSSSSRQSPRRCSNRWISDWSRASRIGLVGSNGSGKTTFLDLIAGRLAPGTGDQMHSYTIDHQRRLHHPHPRLIDQRASRPEWRHGRHSPRALNVTA